MTGMKLQNEKKTKKNRTISTKEQNNHKNDVDAQG